MKIYRLIKNVLYVASIILPLYDAIKGTSSGLKKGFDYYSGLRRLKDREERRHQLKEVIK